MVQAIALFTTAISAAIGEAFVSVSADPLLVWNYGAMAVIAFLSGCLFWLNFRELDAEEDELNELPEGKVYAPDEETQAVQKEEHHSPSPTTEVAEGGAK